MCCSLSGWLAIAITRSHVITKVETHAPDCQYLHGCRLFTGSEGVNDRESSDYNEEKKMIGIMKSNKIINSKNRNYVRIKQESEQKELHVLTAQNNEQQEE